MEAPTFRRFPLSPTPPHLFFLPPPAPDLKSSLPGSVSNCSFSTSSLCRSPPPPHSSRNTQTHVLWAHLHLESETHTHTQASSFPNPRGIPHLGGEGRVVELDGWRGRGTILSRQKNTQRKSRKDIELRLRGLLECWRQPAKSKRIRLFFFFFHQASAVAGCNPSPPPL